MLNLETYISCLNRLTFDNKDSLLDLKDQIEKYSIQAPLIKQLFIVYVQTLNKIKEIKEATLSDGKESKELLRLSLALSTLSGAIAVYLGMLENSELADQFQGLNQRLLEVDSLIKIAKEKKLISFLDESKFSIEDIQCSIRGEPLKHKEVLQN